MPLEKQGIFFKFSRRFFIKIKNEKMACGGEDIFTKINKMVYNLTCKINNK